MLVIVGIECLMSEHILEEECYSKDCVCPCHTHKLKDVGEWRGISKENWIKRFLDAAMGNEGSQ